MVGVLLGHCTLDFVYRTIATPTTKHAAAALTMAQQPHHDESVLVAFLADPCGLPCIR
jgi:hypothetical protein